MEELYWASKGGRPGEAAAGADALGAPMEASAEPAAEGAPAAGEVAEPPAGPGWVIQLTGHHYHNADRSNDTARFVNSTLIKGLAENTVELPDGPNGETVEVPLKDLAITHAWLVQDKQLVDEMIDPDAELYGADGPPVASYGPDGGRGDGGGRDDDDEDEDDAVGAPPKPRWFTVKKYQFVVQFCWQPKTRQERAEAALARAEAEKAAAEAAAAAAGEAPVDGTAPDDAAAGEPPADESAPADEAPADTVPADAAGPGGDDPAGDALPEAGPADGAPPDEDAAEPAPVEDLTSTP
ncbi:MAG TPA: hypothetical protein VEQ85_06890 [Lacipirellulaceae bacterium]|nr:hypothetical protein [Lacipirellulaceae bacterium]